MQVTLIDNEKNPGGVCLYRGCIPSKALLHVAKLLEESRHAKEWGIEFGEPKIDVGANLVLQAQDLADDWEAETDPIQKSRLQQQLGEVREVLDVLRQLNHVYGTSTLGY